MMLNNDGTAVEQASLGMTNAEQIGLETAQEDDERFVEGLERYPDVRHQLTPEQLEAREQRRVELERTFSYDQYKVIRKEMHAGAYDPSVMVRAKTITFNRACINSLENVSYVRIYFSEVLGRLAIQPVERNSPHAMRWCSDRNGKRSPRAVTCPDLTEWLYKTKSIKIRDCTIAVPLLLVGFEVRSLLFSLVGLIVILLFICRLRCYLNSLGCEVLNSLLSLNGILEEVCAVAQ